MEKEKDHINHRLERLVARTERTRLIIFLFVLNFTISGGVVDFIFIEEELRKLFDDINEFYRLFSFSFVFLFILVAALIYVQWHIRRNRPLKFRYKLSITIMESVIPGLLLLVIMNAMDMPALIDSPIIFLYLPILIISILHLDYRLSLLSGGLITVL